MISGGISDCGGKSNGKGNVEEINKSKECGKGNAAKASVNN
jgi:hypothetical protein